MPLYPPPSSAGSAAYAVTAIKTANYSAAINEYIPADASGGAFTITLPSAVGLSGQSIAVKRVDGVYANGVVIDTVGGQTIDQANTKNLYTTNEEYVVVSNGTNWYVDSHYIPSILQSYSPTFTDFTASNVDCKFERQGTEVILYLNFTAASGGAGTASMTLPAGLLSATTGALGSSSATLVGWLNYTVAAAEMRALVVQPSSNTLYFTIQSAIRSSYDQISGGALGAGSMSAILRLPIIGWEQ
jgi:hypothetical protein